MNATAARNADLAEQITRLKAELAELAGDRDRLRIDVGLLFALMSATTARLDAVEGSPATIEGKHAATFKGASFATGYSQSTLRKWIKSGKITAEKIGGHVIIDRRTLPARRAPRTALAGPGDSIPLR